MSTLRQLEVPADWVAHGNLGALPTVFDSELDPGQARELQGSIALVFPELENEADRIFAVPGVLDWLRRLYTDLPHFPYFLVPHPLAGALQGLLLSGMTGPARDEALSSGLLHSDDDLVSWLVERMAATARFATHVGDDWESVVSSFLEPLGDDAQDVVAEVGRRIVVHH